MYGSIRTGHLSVFRPLLLLLLGEHHFHSHIHIHSSLNTACYVFLYYCFSHCLVKDVLVVNVTQAVKMPTYLHENSFRKPSITVNSTAESLNPLWGTDVVWSTLIQTAINDHYAVRHVVFPKMLNPSRGTLSMLKHAGGESPSTFTQTITHTIASKSNTV